MKVAVLMSTYNGEKYLYNQIDSVLQQNGDFSIELIVRDDGSNDKTISILNEYKEKDKLNWYSGDNIGPAKSFIDLLYHSPECDYYAFADQDDVWCLEKIKNGIDALRNHKCPAIYYSNAKLVDDSLKDIGTNVYKNKQNTDLFTIMYSANVLGCTIIMNKKYVDIFKMHRKPEIITMHDSFVARSCLAIGGKLIYVNNNDILYRQHSNNALGIQVGTLSGIFNVLRDITTKSKITLDTQVKEIIDIYKDLIDSDILDWMLLLSEYRTNLFTRLKVALSKRPNFTSFKLAFKIRMSLLLGNR